jgi:hypothetical protein
MISISISRAFLLFHSPAEAPLDHPHLEAGEGVLPVEVHHNIAIAVVDTPLPAQVDVRVHRIRVAQMHHVTYALGGVWGGRG